MSGTDQTEPALEPKHTPISPLTDEINCGAFCCGADEIDKWFSRDAKKELLQHKTRVHFAHSENSTSVKGFYSLSMRLERTDFLSKDERRIRHIYGSYFPALYVGYIAVQRTLQGNDLGTYLWGDAMKRCHKISLDVAFDYVALRAKEEKNVVYYEEEWGFAQLTELPNALMVLPIDFLQEMMIGRPTLDD